jgi:hypothetical protein
MQQICTYRIVVQGEVSERDLKAPGPREMTVVGSSSAATVLATRADQSGLVGLVRHLHGRGFVLLSVTRED